MTTTDLYSGYTTEGKPSSRVLRPPGGESSNIFGEAEPTRQQQMRQEMPPQEGQMQPPGARQTQNPTVDANQQYQKNKPSGKGKFNPITGEEYPADYGQKTTDEDDTEEQETDETDDANKQNDNGDNTPDEKTTTPPAPWVQSAAAPAPFVKVRQPPGGKSSGLW